MKKAQHIVGILMLSCAFNTLLAQQTYERHYSTFSEYGSLPQTTIPSAKPNYQGPQINYDIPKSDKKIAHEAMINDVVSTVEKLKLYYAKNDFNSVISICLDFDAKYKDESPFSEINIYIVSAYLYTKQYDAIINRLTTKSVYFGDRNDFNLAAADLLQQYGKYEEAYWYYNLAKKNLFSIEGYELGFSVTAERQGEHPLSKELFTQLQKRTNNSPINYYNRALLFLNDKNPSPKSALNDLDVYISYGGDIRNAYRLRAIVNSNLQNYEACINDAKEYLKTNDSDECRELIKDAEREIADRPRKIALALEEEKVRKESEEFNKQEKLAREAKWEEERLIAFNKSENEYNLFLQEHNLEDPPIKELDKERIYYNYYDAVWVGDFRAVIKIFNNGDDINEWDSRAYNYTLLNAIAWNKYVIAEFLLENGFNVKNVGKDNYTALHKVCENFWDTELKKWSYGKNNVKLARLIILKGAEVNAVNDYKQSPLHIAVLGDNLELAKLLLENGANPNIGLDYEKNTPLAYAKKNKNKEMITLLKEYGAEQ